MPCLFHCRFASNDEYTTPAVVIATPVITLTVELPPTFSQRIDLSMGLNVPLQQVAGTFEGMLGRTIRGPTSAVQTMEEVRPGDSVCTMPPNIDYIYIYIAPSWHAWIL